MRRQPIYTGSAVLGQGATTTPLQNEASSQTPVEAEENTEAVTETAPVIPLSRNEFRAKMKAQAMSSVAIERTGYPRESIFVIGTLVNGSGQREYRIGMLTHKDLQHHLIDQRYPAGKLFLNPLIAVRCFGKSAVYEDPQTAVSAAQKRWSNAECGVKIVPFQCIFPHSTAN